MPTVGEVKKEAEEAQKVIKQREEDGQFITRKELREILNGK